MSLKPACPACDSLSVKAHSCNHCGAAFLEPVMREPRGHRGPSKPKVRMPRSNGSWVIAGKRTIPAYKT